MSIPRRRLDEGRPLGTHPYIHPDERMNARPASPKPPIGAASSAIPRFCGPRCVPMTSGLPHAARAPSRTPATCTRPT
ncbi:Hypothetical protein A7982_10163 [Minicystis rosea]|nr:Hypothetical protein A7982_10163 [Minicystis rosea]